MREREIAILDSEVAMEKLEAEGKTAMLIAVDREACRCRGSCRYGERNV